MFFKPDIWSVIYSFTEIQSRCEKTIWGIWNTFLKYYMQDVMNYNDFKRFHFDINYIPDL